ncbi:MAG TPA: PilZ domain-containing protein [Terriglobales bacterium]
MRRFTAGERQRAQRFRIQTLLRYRRTGEGEWRQGTIVNISESGVLFETDHSAWPNTAVEMMFSLCTGISGELAAQVVCHGLIARAVSEPGSARVTALAARITKFHFVRPERAPVA